jgi:hypothetical protein
MKTKLNWTLSVELVLTGRVTGHSHTAGFVFGNKYGDHDSRAQLI